MQVLNSLDYVKTVVLLFFFFLKFLPIKTALFQYRLICKPESVSQGGPPISPPVATYMLMPRSLINDI